MFQKEVSEHIRLSLEYVLRYFEKCIFDLFKDVNDMEINVIQALSDPESNDRYIIYWMLKKV